MDTVAVAMEQSFGKEAIVELLRQMHRNEHPPYKKERAHAVYIAVSYQGWDCEQVSSIPLYLEMET